MKSCAARLLPLLSERDTTWPAIYPLIEFDARELIPDLERFLDDASPVLRSAALDTLVGLTSFASAPRIRLCLDDPDLDSRRRAAIGLGDLKDRDAVPRRARLTEDSVRAWRVSACRALGSIGGREATGRLMAALRRKDEDLLQGVALQPGRLRAAEAVPDLMLLLKERPDMGATRVQALAGIGAKEAVPEVIRMLEERESRPLLSALVRLEAAGSIPALRRIPEKGRLSISPVEVAAALADLGEPDALAGLRDSKDHSDPAPPRSCVCEGASEARPAS